MPKLCLTPDAVDAIALPTKGEVWIGDNHVQHFGVRAWAGKKGGGKAYAVRLRDQFGVLVRETYQPDRDFPLYYWARAWEKPLGYFLDPARAWARDRVAAHQGLLTSADRRHQQWQRRKAKVLATTIGDAFDRKMDRLRRKSRDHLYVDHIQNLVGLHVPKRLLGSSFRNVPVRRLADAISQREISYGNVKVLRVFVSGVFKDAAEHFGPLRYKLESIQRRCARNLGARIAPPFPRILQITDDDYRRFFDALESDANWQQALAIRFYFATEAKLQPILRARWSDFLNGTWYPFVPSERKLWFESKQRLNAEALRILTLIEQRHRDEGLVSSYLFPSPKNTAKPVKTVQRHWTRYCGTFAWSGLPISHVVLRHQGRSNPSYSLFFYRTYLQFDRAKSIEAVSKVAKRREENIVNAATYMVGRNPPEILIT